MDDWNAGYEIGYDAGWADASRNAQKKIEELRKDELRLNWLIEKISTMDKSGKPQNREYIDKMIDMGR